MLQLPCMLVCSFVCANRTRDRGCSKHPVFPAPSISKRAKRRCKPRAKRAARTRSYIRRHCERSEAIHLSLSRAVGCFAALTMTWRETAAYRCMFGSIISIDLYKQEPIFILPKAQGERYADRRRQGIGACLALSAQF